MDKKLLKYVFRNIKYLIETFKTLSIKKNLN